jgi:signal transduction histidine kinase
MPDPIGVAIAFSALGANVLATGLLLLFNPRSLEVRWYAAFLTAISLWLLALGVIGLTGEPGGPWRTLYAAAVFVMPGLFMASTLTQVAEARVWARWTAVGATALAVPLGIEVMTGETTAALGLVALGWQVVAWGGASYLQWRSSRSERSRLPERRLAHRLVNGLLVLPGVVVAGAMMLGGEAFFTYVMPLIVFVIHFVIFVGVVRLRFYDIEVRAARSGEIAGRAVEVERLAAVGELAASVGVRSLAQRMAEEEVDPERWRRYSAVIMEEIGRVDGIVGNLLAVSRHPPATRSKGPTDLEQLFDDLLLLTAARARRDGVTLRADAGGVVAPAGREPLAQVLLNLLLNAIDHSPEHGTVRMVARDDPVEIAVRDSGPGVRPADRDRIFEPFHTAGTDGSGLGLSVVRRIAREQGWTVGVEDAPDGGAEFRVVLGERGSGAGRSPAGMASRGLE